jgi:hypothetical protein
MSLVDDHLETFENSLSRLLDHELLIMTDRDAWQTTGHLPRETVHGMRVAVEMAHYKIISIYKDVPDVLNLLLNSQLLINNCLWVAMSIPPPRPEDMTAHSIAVLNNVMSVWNEVVYPALRREMCFAPQENVCWEAQERPR